MLKLVLTFVLVALSATAATADPAEDRVRAVIAEWYAELVRLEKGNAYRLTAPGYIDASPHYEYVDTGSAALGPRVFTSLAATALQFEHEITSIRLDPNFAKVRVWGEDRAPLRGITEARPPRISGLARLVSVLGLPAS